MKDLASGDLKELENELCFFFKHYFGPASRWKDNNVAALADLLEEDNWFQEADFNELWSQFQNRKTKASLMTLVGVLSGTLLVIIDLLENLPDKTLCYQKDGDFPTSPCNRGRKRITNT